MLATNLLKGKTGIAKILHSTIDHIINQVFHENHIQSKRQTIQIA